MSKDFLKRLTEAHSWLGLIISGLLFIVFFAGSASLFRDEIEQWSIQPHLTVSETPQHNSGLPINKVLSIAADEEGFVPKGRLLLLTPNDNRPYYKATVSVLNEQGKKKRRSFYIDPNTGEKFYNTNKFKLSRFIYDLHQDLKIPKAGEYIVGLITLFFFFALISGIFIHARKLIRNFFKYRSEDKSRSKLLDMHNVVGVMSLPFTVMYALSGLIFNLVIIYQVAFAVFLYKGDQQALLTDAGVKRIKVEWQNEPLSHHSIDQLFHQTKEKYNHVPYSIQVFNYGDKSSVVRFFIRENNNLTINNDIAYYLKDNSVHSQFDTENGHALRQGLRVLSSLHFADFAGFDLRLLYFILGIGVCGLIVTGNLLWIDKRARQRAQTPKTLTFVKGYTVLSTGGVVFATAIAFLIERLLPMHMEHRADFMMSSFFAALFIIAALLCFSSNKKCFLGWLLRLSALLGILVVMFDWVLFSDEIIQLWKQGITTIFATEIFLSIFSLLLFVIGHKLIKKSVIVQHISTKDNN